MSIAHLAHFDADFCDADSLARWTILPGQVVKVPQRSCQVRVLAGTAWVTVAGQDLILRAGEWLLLPSGRPAALISALKQEPVTLMIQEPVRPRFFWDAPIPRPSPL